MLYTPRVEKLSSDLSAATAATMKEKAAKAHREQESCVNSSNLSSRSEDLKLAAKEFEAINELWDDFYDADTNPNGIFSLGVAENSIMHDELSKFLNENLKITPFCHTYGDGGVGSKRLRGNLCGLFNKYFKPSVDVAVEHVQISSGVTSIINNLVYALADEGDGILIARPLYAGFSHDIHTKNKVHMVPVSLKTVDDPMGLEAVKVHEEVLREQNRNGVKIKGMILCNPHNPLGRCYPRETIEAYMKLCQKYQIHFVSDEVYALSVFETEDGEGKRKPEPFVSALSIYTEGIIDKRLVTVIYGMSKDFSSNGFRCAALVNQSNTPLLDATGTLNVFTWPSSLSDLAWSTVLEDEKFLSYYIPENQRRLSSSYSLLTTFLKNHDIPYEPTYAGFFVWCDFRKFLPPLPADLKGDEEALKSKLNSTKIPWASDEERWRDDEFYRRMIKARLYLATSSAFHGEEHGWYRITFSMPEKELKFGLDRLGKLLQQAGDGWKDEGDNGVNGADSKVGEAADTLKNTTL